MYVHILLCVAVEVVLRSVSADRVRMTVNVFVQVEKAERRFVSGDVDVIVQI